MFQRRTKLNPVDQMRQILQPAKGYNRPLIYFMWRIKRLQGTPEYVARGFAIGVAINFWPILFTHMVLGLLFCRILRGNWIAMFIGTLIGNPGTFAIVYPIMYKIGKVVLGLRPRHPTHAIDSMEEIWAKIWPIESWHNLVVVFQEFLWPLMIGGFLLGLPCTILSYYLVRNGVRVYQNQRRKHLLRIFEEVEKEIEQPHHSE